MHDYFLSKTHQGLALEVLCAAIYTLFPSSRVSQKKSDNFGFSFELLIDHKLDALSQKMIKARYLELLSSCDIKISQMLKDNAVDFLKYRKCFDLAKQVKNTDESLVSLFHFADHYSLVSQEIDLKKINEIAAMSLDFIILIKTEKYPNKTKYVYKFLAKAASSYKILEDFEKEHMRRKNKSHLTKASRLGFLKKIHIQGFDTFIWTMKGIDFKKALVEKIDFLRYKASFDHSCIKFAAMEENINFFKQNSCSEHYKLSFWRESVRENFNLEDGLLNLPLSTDNIGLVDLRDQDFNQELVKSLNLMMACLSIFSRNFYFELEVAKNASQHTIDSVNKFFTEHQMDVKVSKKVKDALVFNIVAYVQDVYLRPWQVASLAYSSQQNILCHRIFDVDRLCALYFEAFGEGGDIPENVNKKLKNNISKMAMSVNL